MVVDINYIPVAATATALLISTIHCVAGMFHKHITLLYIDI